MLRFRRPKGPGFGISGGFYMSVLSAQATLPPLLRILNPSGEGGAVTGFGIPMAANAPKESLARPMERGIYAMASKDRKTVFKVSVFSKEEAGFDPESVARHSESLGIDGELVDRIRATWNIVQFMFESYDPEVYPALDILLGLVARIGNLTDGAIADPVCMRYRLPDQVFASPRVNPLVDAREHVEVHLRGAAAGVHAFTKGLQKFALPELEIQALSPGSELGAQSLLLTLCQRELEGKLIQAGQQVGKFQVKDGGFDRALWEGIPCLELMPPATMSATEALETAT